MAGESQSLNEQEIKQEAMLASYVLAKYQEWDGYKETQKTTWKEVEVYKYATDTKDAMMSNSFDHSNHIPVVNTIAQDLEAIVGQVTSPHNDWFTFNPQDRESAQKERVQKVISYLKNRHKVSNFSEVKEKLDGDLVTYGNAFALVDFSVPADNDKVGYLGPKAVRISPYDIVFNPTAPSFEDATKIIKEVVDLGTIWKWKEQGLVDKQKAQKILDDRVHFQSMSNSDKDKQYKAGFTTYDAYMTSGVVEILWFYGDIYDVDSQKFHFSKKLAVVDGKYLLIDEKIDTPTGKPHIYHAVWQRRPDNLWGMGPLDNIIGLNHQINHRENSKNDALDKTIYPDKVFLGDVEEVYDDETGQTIYLAPEGGGVNELAINTQFFANDLQIDRLNEMAKIAARLPQDLVGFRSPGEKTFGEVSALTEGAMRGFIHKILSYEKFLEKILNAELVLASQNASSLLVVEGQSEGGVIPFLEVTKKDLQVTGSLSARGATRFNRKNQVLSTISQLQQSGMLELISTHLNTSKLAGLVEELAEIEGTGVVEEYAMVYEQMELQDLQTQAELQSSSTMMEPTMEELEMEDEMDVLDGEA